MNENLDGNPGVLEHDAPKAHDPWARELRLTEYEAEIASRDADVDRLEGQLQALHSRLKNQQACHLHLMEQMREEIVRLRTERDDLALAARAQRERMCGLPPPAAETALVGVERTARPDILPGSLRQLRVAGIMDEFTFNAFKPSCNLCPVSASQWKTQVEQFHPQLLLVESAWQGNNGEWAGKIGHPSRELSQLLAWCKHHNVATVFWNKEDPVHFSTFLNTAKLFDHVFTTDLDCIGQYKSLLGHERVYLMPFACQPRMHNPIATLPRKSAFCFAGAYYVRYPERQRDFDTFISALEPLRPVEIFDRNHGKTDANYMFPEQYQRLILGNLPYAEIDRAYKGYEFGINLNSVKQSQTMFARRAFDLLLCNTHVVSNYSRGLRRMFGGLVTSTDDRGELIGSLQPLLAEDDAHDISFRRQHRLLGLRKVLLEHTVDRRLAYIVSKVTGRVVEPDLPSVAVVAVVGNEGEMARAIHAYERQHWQRKRMVLILRNGFRPGQPLRGRRDISVLRQSNAAALAPAVAWSGEVVAFFSNRDFYGTEYLTDLALGFLYAEAEVVGKGAWYQPTDGGELKLHGNGSQYRWQLELPLRRSLAAAVALAGSSLWEWAEELDARRLGGDACLAVDEFSYVAETEADRHPELDEPAIDRGMSIEALLDRAERIKCMARTHSIEQGFDAREMAQLFGGGIGHGLVRIALSGDALVLTSSLEETAHKYVYATRMLDVAELASGDELTFHLVAGPGMHLDTVLIFFAADGTRLGQAINTYGRNHSVPLPEGTTQVRFGLRVLGPGHTVISGFSTRALSFGGQLAPQIGRSRHLLLTNVYPSAKHLYRNGFVHRRVLGYRSLGTEVDVFTLNEKAVPHGYDFDGVEVSVGDRTLLQARLQENPYETVLVHFLDEKMWEVIEPLLPTTQVIVWVHGVEIQPWWRRMFNYRNAAEKEAAAATSELRMSFWRHVMTDAHPNLRFVFVSRQFANEAMGDIGVSLDERQYEVIHNVVDGSLFRYEKKDPEQRLNILSIRPYASATYANDLSVAAVLRLRDKPFFDELSFRFIGDGPLFDDVLAPLRDLPNVTMERRFLTQQEIAELHRDHGVFLCPTRMDTQGVSRDEAMASGLVPVTSRCAAVPEFVDSETGFLAPPEDPDGLAAAIEQLYEDPAMFERLSANAATRVRAQSGFEQTIVREVALFSASVNA